MSNLLNCLKNETNYIHTENGALTHISTLNAVYDMFAMGGAMTKRDEQDIIIMFRNAFDEDATLALKCLFYLRDIRGGQGVRRFFRICINDLAKRNPDAMMRNIKNIPKYGRWDDLYALVGTPCEDAAFEFIKEQLEKDVQSQTPSLCAKWLASINTSSEQTRAMGNLTRQKLGLSFKQYRKMLAMLRERIKIIERLLTEKRYNEIKFEDVPAKAGMKYEKTFLNNDFLKERYQEFINDKATKVHADILNPVDIANKIINKHRFNNIDPNSTEAAVLEKYWENLKDYYNGREENGIAIVDVSGSMLGTPMAAAIGMGIYVAERGKGPFANHFITFSEKPELIRVQGDNIVDKCYRMGKADWGYNTNLEAVFDLLLDTAIKNNIPADEFVKRVYCFTDMEFDEGTDYNSKETLIDTIIQRYKDSGYEPPQLIFWNLNSRQNNIPSNNEDYISCVSGNSMVLIEQVLSGKTGIDIMKDKLLSKRYDTVM